MKQAFAALFTAAALSATTAAAAGLRGVHGVSVVRDGLWRPGSSSDETPARCRNFRLSSPAARRWFARAHRVDRHAWFELLDWTHCSAEGTLVDRGGRTRRWELDVSGRGRVILSPTRDVYLAGPELPFASSSPAPARSR